MDSVVKRQCGQRTENAVRFFCPFVHQFMPVQSDEGMIFTVEANKYFEQTGIDIGVQFKA